MYKISFKKLFIGFFFGVLPFIIIWSILNLFGLVFVNFNNEPTSGIWSALGMLIIYPPILGGLFASGTWFHLKIGFYIYHKLVPRNKNIEDK